MCKQWLNFGYDTLERDFGVGALDSNSSIGFGKHWIVVVMFRTDYEIKIAITNSSDHLDVFSLQSICLMETLICHKAF